MSARKKSGRKVSGRCSVSGKSKANKKSRRFRGEEIHVDIHSHNPKGARNLSGAKKSHHKVKSHKHHSLFTIGGQPMAAKRKAAKRRKGGDARRMHGGESAGNPGRRAGQKPHARGRSRSVRHHGLLMGGKPAEGIMQALLAIATGLVGAAGAGLGAKYIPGSVMVKNGVPAALGIGLTLMRNPLIKGLGLGMAIVGTAKLVKGFAPQLPLLGDDTVYLLPDGRMVSGDGVPLQIEDARAMGEQAMVAGDQIAVQGEDEEDTMGWATAANY